MIDCGALLMMGAALPVDVDVPMAPPAAAAARASLAEAPAVVEDDELAGLEVVPDEELAGYRGGFTWKGVQIGLGAEMRTYMNGEIALQTNISWTETGAQTTQFVSGALSPADATQLQAGVLTSGGISMKVGNENVFLANEGNTAIVHRTDGAIQNVFLNRATDVQARMEVDAVLDLQNFGQFQQDLTATSIGHVLGDTVGHMTIGGLSH